LGKDLRLSPLEKICPYAYGLKVVGEKLYGVRGWFAQGHYKTQIVL